MIIKLFKTCYLLVLLTLFSCKVIQPGHKHLSKYRNVLILGNSITWHKPAPEMGWYGNWGMAASARDSDYVHILSRKLKIVAPASVLNFRNIADFERDYRNYDLSKLDSLKKLKPELIIVRLGENVDPKTALQYDFEKYYARLLAFLTDGNPKVRVIHASSFWKKEAVARLILNVSRGRGETMVDLSKIAEDPANMALNEFRNKGVAMHPSDRGMRAIAEAIWTEIVRQ